MPTPKGNTPGVTQNQDEGYLCCTVLLLWKDTDVAAETTGHPPSWKSGLWVLYRNQRNWSQKGHGMTVIEWK